MEDFVRRWNIDGVVRDWPPIPSISIPERRGILNEAGFRMFRYLHAYPPSSYSSAVQLAIDSAIETASIYVLGKDKKESFFPVSDSERREVLVLGARTAHYFSQFGTGAVISPSYKGSGIINSCSGDVEVGEDCLFEIKSGDRAFRSIDYRQLLVYSALRFAEVGKGYGNLGVLNPRTGMSIMVDSETIAREVSGQSSTVLYQSLVESFSAHSISD